MLLHLWDRHPPSRDFRCIAQNIIKSTSVSFTGHHIDSIFFKDQGFSLKIKREAIKLLSEMATVIQKNVRRYLVLLTSSYHANKVSRSFQYSHPQHRNNYKYVVPSPIKFSPPSAKWHNSTTEPHLDNDHNTNSLLVEEAIRAQALAEVEASTKCTANSSGDGDVPCGSNKKASSVSFSVQPPHCLSHAEKVAALLDERKKAEVQERSDILSKKKQAREHAKALKLAEREQKLLDADSKEKVDAIESAVRVRAVDVKLRAKASLALKEVEDAALAEAKALEDEETAKMKALQKKVLDRKASVLDVSPKPTFKAYHMKKAQDKVKLEGGENTEIQASLQQKESEDIDLDVLDDNVEDMPADELFRMKLEQNARRERKIVGTASGAMGPGSAKKAGTSLPGSTPGKHKVAGAGAGAGAGATVEQGNGLTSPQQREVAVASSGVGGRREMSPLPPKVDKPTREPKTLDDKLPPHLFDKYFIALQDNEQKTVSKEDIVVIFAQIKSDSFLNQPSLHAVESDEKLMSWVDALFLSILKCKDSTAVVLAGLKIAVMFPFDRLPIPDHRVSFCGVISKILSPHIDCEDYCVEVLQHGAKFTSKKKIQNIEQAVNNEGLEIILKVLLMYGQKRDVIGNAPKVVVTCLKYLRNICQASLRHTQVRLMAAGVGSCLVKLLVFYRTDEAVVSAVCRSIASLIKNTTYLTNFASPECLNLYMLILKTNPMNKTIAKTIGVLLIEIYTADPNTTKEVFLKVDFANLLNNLLLAQMELSSRFSLSVIECNIMMTSFFIIQVSYLKPEFLRLDVVTTLQQYQENQQNFGNNIDVVIQKCLKHLTSSSIAK